jgi:acetyltransferase-like isoleucine patch superfamily enzyme
LAQVIGKIIDIWPLTAAGFFDVCRTSWNYPELYQKLLPAFARKARRNLRQLPHRWSWRIARRLFRSFGERFGAELYPVAQETLDKAARKYFCAQAAGAHPNANVRHPVYLMNPKYFQIGSNFNAQPGLRLEAWDAFGGEHFYPLIKIGDNVSLNWNVHIGAINRIEIHDNVLVGSHVLITDHAHGTVDARDLAAAPAQRPLSSKGPVVIERDVWIGEGVCILAGVTIGEGAVIGANAVVTADVPPRCVVGGVPARIIRKDSQAAKYPCVVS